MKRISSIAVAMVWVWLLTAAPAAAKGLPRALHVPAHAYASDVITVRAVIRSLVPPPVGPDVVSDGIGMRRVTATKPVMAIGTGVIRSALIHRRGHVYIARVQVPPIPGRYVVYPAPSVVRSRPTDLGPVAFLRVRKHP